MGRPKPRRGARARLRTRARSEPRDAPPTIPRARATPPLEARPLCSPTARRARRTTPQSPSRTRGTPPRGIRSARGAAAPPRSSTPPRATPRGRTPERPRTPPRPRRRPRRPRRRPPRKTAPAPAPPAPTPPAPTPRRGNSDASTPPRASPGTRPEARSRSRRSGRANRRARGRARSTAAPSAPVSSNAPAAEWPPGPGGPPIAARRDDRSKFAVARSSSSTASAASRDGNAPNTRIDRSRSRAGAQLKYRRGLGLGLEEGVGVRTSRCLLHRGLGGEERDGARVAHERVAHRRDVRANVRGARTGVRDRGRVALELVRAVDELGGERGEPGENLTRQRELLVRRVRRARFEKGENLKTDERRRAHARATGVLAALELARALPRQVRRERRQGLESLRGVRRGVRIVAMPDRAGRRTRKRILQKRRGDAELLEPTLRRAAVTGRDRTRGAG